MSKVQLLLMLLCLSMMTCTTSTNNLENSSWIIIDQEHYPDAGFLRVINGGLLHFDSDSLVFGSPYGDNILAEKYEFTGETITVDSLPFGRVLMFSPDTLVLEDKDSSYAITFLRLSESRQSINQEEFVDKYLSNTVLDFESGYMKYRYYFDTTNYSKDVPLFSKNYLVYERELDFDGFEETGEMSNENWLLKEFYGSLILYHSVGGMAFSDYITYQVIEASEESIEVICRDNLGLLPIEASSLKLIRLSDDELSLKKSQLVGRWKTKEVLQSVEEEKDDANEMLEDKTGFRYELISEFHKNRLVDRADIAFPSNIEMSFTKDVYKMLIDGVAINTDETWKLTNDGKFLNLHSGVAIDDFVELVDQSEEELTIIITLSVRHPEHANLCKSVKYLMTLSKE